MVNKVNKLPLKDVLAAIGTQRMCGTNCQMMKGNKFLFIC